MHKKLGTYLLQTWKEWTIVNVNKYKTLFASYQRQNIAHTTVGRILEYIALFYFYFMILYYIELLKHGFLILTFYQSKIMFFFIPNNNNKLSIIQLISYPGGIFLPVPTKCCTKNTLFIF